MNAHNPPPKIDIGKRAGQYVELRDKIKAMDDAHKSTMAPYRDMLDTLGNTLLKFLEQTNSESTRTTGGTVSKSTRRTASLADPDLFMRHVIGTEEWDLLDRRANATAVADYVAEHGVLPPGVNLNTRVEVSVRRPSSTD